jgi:hypothetical protein
VQACYSPLCKLLIKDSYVPNLGSTTALALVATVAPRNAPMMVGFLTRHIQPREYFAAKVVCIVLEQVWACFS